MVSLSLRGKEISLNADGYLENFDSWDDEVCEALAEAEDLELDEHRWCAIRFFRKFYATMGTPPSTHVVVRDIGGQLAHFGCTGRTIGLLFPNGGCRQACRLAGLPFCFTTGC